MRTFTDIDFANLMSVLAIFDFFRDKLSHCNLHVASDGVVEDITIDNVAVPYGLSAMYEINMPNMIINKVL